MQKSDLCANVMAFNIAYLQPEGRDGHSKLQNPFHSPFKKKKVIDIVPCLWQLSVKNKHLNTYLTNSRSPQLISLICYRELN